MQLSRGEMPIPLADAIIFDVDGTLCDVRSIRYHVEDPERPVGFRPNFNRFHSDSISCPPHSQVVGLLNRARAAGFAILIVTGREEKWSFLTSRWLYDWSISYDELIMRPARDNRSDAIVKADMEQDISTRYNAQLAVDDRLDIISVWHSAGIATCRVSEEGEIGPVQWPPDAPRLELSWMANIWT